MGDRASNVQRSSATPLVGRSTPTRTSTLPQGNQLFNTASNIGNRNLLGNTTGNEQTRATNAARQTGDDMIDSSNKLEKTKQDVATAQGMNELYTSWVRNLWKA